ncbi:LysR family transcriptional regulator, partial [Vibrio sinaloensis]
GIGRLVLPALKAELKTGELIPVLEDKWPTYPGLYLYFSRNSQRVKRVRVLIDYLMERFE